MPVFHTRECETNTTRASRALRALQAELRKLCEGALASADFECFEREVHALFAQAEREVLGEQLESLDVDLPYVTIDGRRHCRVVRSKQTYTSAAGPVTVARTLYRAGKGRSVVPVQLRAGIVEGRWTPLAARQASYLVAHLTPQACEDTLRDAVVLRHRGRAADDRAHGPNAGAEEGDAEVDARRRGARGT